MINWHAISEFIKYQIKSKHAKGYGVHSPFVFDFIRETIYQKEPFYHFDTIKNVRSKYASSNKLLNSEYLGAGFRAVQSSKQKRICDIAKTSAIKPKYGELLFRIVARSKPDNIIELGTSLGISTLYLALPDRRKTIYSIEGNTELVSIAQNTFELLGLKDIQLVNGLFDDELPRILNSLETVDFVYFDGNHKKEATLNYFNLCLEKKNNESIFVFDDIHWSPEMTEAWEIIRQHPQITVSIDLFQLGIVFFRRECQKQHFIVRF